MLKSCLRSAASASSLMVTAVVVAVLSGTVWADTTGSSGANHLSPPKASLQSRVHQEVAHDQLQITLQVQVSEASQQKASSELSKQLDEGLEQARRQATDGVRVQSGPYQVWPITNEEGKVTGWRGRADIQLESSDFQAVSELAAQLEDSMAVVGLNFFVSPEKRAQAQSALLEQAVTQFQERAQRLSRAFGYRGYQLNEVDLGGSGDQFAPMVRQAADAPASMSRAIPVEAGTETISLTVQGSIYLLDKPE